MGLGDVMYERYDPDDEWAIEEEGGWDADRSYWDIKEGMMNWMSQQKPAQEIGMKSALKQYVLESNDYNTWTWQIDHIVPHSKFKYTSMGDKEFVDCWALSNLRPFSAKRNISDGNRRCA